ncbi:MAG: exodeoxyribonuclease VII large subunit [Betaproteobacteria bacterium RIFCSPLOWO2_02_FULL_67_26]|nr:MAG: exodeoxyribonuclease VII large subunit [Betaproteobacteria bacterium RIFCSPLOWO2_02_FULL_67_26]
MAERLPEPVLPQVISVAELNRIARDLLERSLPLMWVAGEISNFKRYESGHCYFTLKDGAAQVDCVMFRHRAQLAGWLPQDGMRVEVRALATLYEARGRFQLNVEAMRRAGLGALYEAFERLKAKLEKDGLFDPARKRPLPRFPRAVGVVTSPQAAALRDVLATLAKRMARLPVILYPTPVQGEGAGGRIAAAIALAGARRDCDVLILCRGGGSIEDLWAFNEEAVARAIRDCAVPVVTGIGHETDFTIADFAADARAPTPTAAAALASPARDELAKLLAQDAHRLLRAARRALEYRMQGVDLLSRRLVHPGERIRNQLGELRHLATRLAGAWERGREDLGWQARELRLRLREGIRRRLAAEAVLLERLEAHLRHLNPQSVLERGYSITESAAGGIVRDAARLAVGEDVTISFARGRVGAQVNRKA